jgi:hypothetical protein
MRADTNRVTPTADYPARKLAPAAPCPPAATKERREECLEPPSRSSSEAYLSFSKSPMLQLLSKYAFVGA